MKEFMTLGEVQARAKELGIGVYMVWSMPNGVIVFTMTYIDYSIRFEALDGRIIDTQIFNFKTLKSYYYLVDLAEYLY